MHFNDIFLQIKQILANQKIFYVKKFQANLNVIFNLFVDIIR